MFEISPETDTGNNVDLKIYHMSGFPLKMPVCAVCCQRVSTFSKTNAFDIFLRIVGIDHMVAVATKPLWTNS